MSPNLKKNINYVSLHLVVIGIFLLFGGCASSYQPSNNMFNIIKGMDKKTAAINLDRILNSKKIVAGRGDIHGFFYDPYTTSIKSTIEKLIYYKYCDK